MREMRVGVVGLGWAAGAHIEAFKHVQGAQVTAVCSRRRRDPAQLETKYGLPLTAYDDYDVMLQDETVDIVDLDDKFHSAKLGTDKSRWSALATHLVDSGDVKDHPYPPQFQAFVDAARAGRKMPLTDLETALETHRVIFAADLSAKKGEPVRLSKMR